MGDFYSPFVRGGTLPRQSPRYPNKRFHTTPYYNPGKKVRFTRTTPHQAPNNRNYFHVDPRLLAGYNPNNDYYDTTRCQDYNEQQAPAWWGGYQQNFPQRPQHTDRYFNGHLAIDSFPEEILCWDLFTTPTQLASKAQMRRSRILDQPVTQPSIRELKLSFRDEHNYISCSALSHLTRKWGSIIVTPSGVTSTTSNAHQHSIVIRDLVKAVYEYFSTPLSNEDISLFDPATHQRVMRAHGYRLAYYDRQDDRDGTWRSFTNDLNTRYFVRADLLNGCVTFKGIQDVWWNDVNRTAGGTMVLKKLQVIQPSYIPPRD